MGALDQLTQLAIAGGELGSAAESAINHPPRLDETPADTTRRVIGEGIRQERAQRMRAADFAAQGVPTYRDTTGSVQPVRDESGAALTGLDKRNSVAWDSLGEPVRITPTTNGVALSDPYASGQQRTDKKTGDQYTVAPGLPWRWEGRDEQIVAANEQAAKDKAIAQAASALGGKLSLDHHAAVTATQDLKKTQKDWDALSGQFGINPADAAGAALHGAIEQGDPSAAHAAIDAHFNTLYGSREANATKGLFSNELSPAAQQYRASLDAGKARAHTVAENLMNQRARRDGALARENQTRQLADTARTQNVERKLATAGLSIPAMDAPAETISDDGHATPGEPAGGSSLPHETPAAEPFTREQPPVRQAQDGSMEFDPQRLVEGLTQAYKAGAIDKERFKELLPKAQAAQKAAKDQAKLLANDSMASKLKALGVGATKGAAFLAGAPAGAAIGGEIGTAIAPGLGSAIGAGLGGLITGTAASFGADKLLRKLGEYSDTIKSFSDAADAHPYFNAGGNLIAFGVGIPKAAMKAAGAALAGNAGLEAGTVGSRIAEEAALGTGTLNRGEALKAALSPSNLRQAVARGVADSGGGLGSTIESLSGEAATRLAAGAKPADVAKIVAARVGGNALGMAALDTAIKEGSRALGWSDEGQTPGGAAQAALIGAFVSGHGITVPGKTSAELADILARWKARENAGVAYDQPLSPEQMPAGVDMSGAAALAKPLSTREMLLVGNFEDEMRRLVAEGKIKAPQTDADPIRLVKSATGSEVLQNGIRQASAVTIKPSGEASKSPESPSAPSPSGSGGTPSQPRLPEGSPPESARNQPSPSPGEPLPEPPVPAGGVSVSQPATGTGSYALPTSPTPQGQPQKDEPETPSAETQQGGGALSAGTAEPSATPAVGEVTPGAGAPEVPGLPATEAAAPQPRESVQASPSSSPEGEPAATDRQAQIAEKERQLDDAKLLLKSAGNEVEAAFRKAEIAKLEREVEGLKKDFEPRSTEPAKEQSPPKKTQGVEVAGVQKSSPESKVEPSAAAPIETAPSGDTQRPSVPAAEPKPPELMTPVEHARMIVERDAAAGSIDAQRALRGEISYTVSPDGQPVYPSTGQMTTTAGARNTIKVAIDARKPINADLYDGHAAESERPIILPEGYVREGDRYVYKPSNAEPPEPARAPEPASAAREPQAVQPKTEAEPAASAPSREQPISQPGKGGGESGNAPSHELTLEQQKAIAESDERLKSAKRMADRWEQQGNREQAEKIRKGAGMQHAAEIRQITGKLTAKEQAAKDARERGNYVGKPVSVDGRNATVTGNPFGKVSVRFDDGSTKTVAASEIKEPLSNKPEPRETPPTHEPAQPTETSAAAKGEPGESERPAGTPQAGEARPGDAAVAGGRAGSADAERFTLTDASSRLRKLKRGKLKADFDRLGVELFEGPQDGPAIYAHENGLKITFNPKALAEWMDTVRANGRDVERWLRDGALGEELIHTRQLMYAGRAFQSQYEAIWKEMPETLRRLFAEHYLSANARDAKGAIIPHIGAAEWERMVIQWRTHGTTSEELFGRDIAALKPFLDAPQGDLLEKSIARVESLVADSREQPPEHSEKPNERAVEANKPDRPRITREDYEAERERSNEASRAFAEKQRAYRAKEIGDAEFLAAKAEHDAASARFDEAFSKPLIESGGSATSRIEAEQFPLLQVPKTPKPKAALRNQLRRLIERQAKVEGFDDEEIRQALKQETVFRDGSERLLNLERRLRAVEHEMLPKKEGDSVQPKPEETPKPPAPVKPTKRIDESFLHVEIPDAEEARKRVAAFNETAGAIQKEAMDLEDSLKKLAPEVVKTTGRSWERGQIKKSAPKAKVKLYLDWKKKIEEKNEAIRLLRAQAAPSAKIERQAVLAKRVNDESLPLLGRLAARRELMFDEWEANGKAIPKALEDAINHEAGLVILQKYPDATPEEVQRATPKLAALAGHGHDYDRAFDLDPELNIAHQRAREIITKLNPKGMRYVDTAHPISNFSEDLQNRINAGVPDFRDWQKKNDPLSTLSRAQTDAILADIDTENAAAAVKAAEQAKLDQEEAARKAELNARVETVTAGDAKDSALKKALADAKGDTTTPKVMKAQGEYLQDAIQQAIKESDGNGRIRFDVPGDGTFVVFNTPEQLRAFAKQTKNAFSVPGSTFPNQMKVSGVEQRKAPAKVDDTKLFKELAEFVSDDEARNNIKHVIGTGDELIASDAVMIVAKKSPNAGTPDNPIHLSATNGKPVTDEDELPPENDVTAHTFRNYLNAVPEGPSSHMAVEDLYRMASAAEALRTNTAPARIWRNEDGTLGVTLFDGAETSPAESNGYYEGNKDDGAVEVVAVDPKRLRDVLAFMAKAGEETIKVSAVQLNGRLGIRLDGNSTRAVINGMEPKEGHPEQMEQLAKAGLPNTPIEAQIEKEQSALEWMREALKTDQTKKPPNERTTEADIKRSEERLAMLKEKRDAAGKGQLPPGPVARTTESPKAVAKPAPTQEQGRRRAENARAVEPKAAGGGSINNFETLRTFINRLVDGDVTAEQVKAAWGQFKENETAIKTDLARMTKDELLRLNGMRASKSDTKQQLLDGALSGLAGYFNPTGMLSYGTVTGDMKAAERAARDKAAEGWTDEIIQQQAQERRDAKAAREKAITNPETKEEFERYIIHAGSRGLSPEEEAESSKLKGYALRDWVTKRGEAKLTPEQLAKYDELRGIDRKAEQERERENQATVRQVYQAKDVPMTVSKHPHEKRGHDVWIVRNVVDTAHVQDKEKSDVFAVFDPSQVRRISNPESRAPSGGAPAESHVEYDEPERRLRALELISSKRTLNPKEQQEYDQLRARRESAETIGADEGEPRPDHPAGTPEHERATAERLERAIRFFAGGLEIKVERRPSARGTLHLDTRTGTIGYNPTNVAAKHAALEEFEKGRGNKWISAAADEEVAHWIDGFTSQMRGTDERAFHEAVWRSAPEAVRSSFSSAYTSEVTPRTAGAELVRMLDQVERTGQITESLMPDRDLSAFAAAMNKWDIPPDLVRHLRTMRTVRTMWPGDDSIELHADQPTNEPPPERSAEELKKSGLTPEEALLIGPVVEHGVKGWRRLFDGTADVLERTKGLEELGQAVRRHVDRTREIIGKVSVPYRELQSKESRASFTKAEKEVETFYRLTEQKPGQPLAEGLPSLTPEAFEQQMSAEGKAHIGAWRAVAKRFSDFQKKLGVKVKTAEGEWREIGQVKDYHPRMLRADYLNAINNPRANPREWREVVKIMMDAGMGNSPAEVMKEFATRFRDAAENDFFSNIERARELPLPHRLYDYSFKARQRYILNSAERLAQIEAYGQKTTPGTQDAFDKAISSTYDHPTQEYIKAVRDRAYGRVPRTMFFRGLAALNALATGTQLGNPVTVVTNLLSGIGYNVSTFGFRNSLKSLRALRHLGSLVDEAHARGVLLDDLMSMYHDTEQYGSNMVNKIQNATGAALKFTGYNASETFVRAMGLANAKEFLRYALQQRSKDSNSHASRSATAFFKRNAINAEKLYAENGEGPETDRFYRATVNASQGGYRFDQVPVYQDTPIGKFLFKYQKWGAQATRHFVKNVIEPAIGRGGPVDVAPLLRYLLTTAGVGMGLVALKQAVFGTPDRTASLEEIGKTWTEDERRALALAAQKLWMVQMATGAYGLIGNYSQVALDFADRSKFKNPLEPPGLAVVTNAGEQLMRAFEQKTLTAKDADDYLKSQLSLYRTMEGALGRVGLNDRESARQDLSWLGAQTRRFADEVGIEASRTSMGRVGKTEQSPAKRDLLDALRTGDVPGAKAAAKEYVDSLPQEKRGDAMKSLAASVRASQPVKVGVAGEARRELFLAWAQRRLPAGDVARIRRIDETYRSTAARAGLFNEKPVAPMKVAQAAAKFVPSGGRQLAAAGSVWDRL